MSAPRDRGRGLAEPHAGPRARSHGGRHRLAPPLQSLFVVLVGSSLIGLIASGIERRVAELRKGRSEVLEDGHILILGWSEKVFPVISELFLAHRGRTGTVIVVLADHDKIDMEDAIRARVRHVGHVRSSAAAGTRRTPPTWPW